MFVRRELLYANTGRSAKGKTKLTEFGSREFSARLRARRDADPRRSGKGNVEGSGRSAIGTKSEGKKVVSTQPATLPQGAHRHDGLQTTHLVSRMFSTLSRTLPCVLAFLLLGCNGDDISAPVQGVVGKEAVLEGTAYFTLACGGVHLDSTSWTASQAKSKNYAVAARTGVD